MKIGIMSAMSEEISLLIKAICKPKMEAIGNREYYLGNLWENEVVLVFSRWGKVACTSTIMTLILKYKVDMILFTGVAGAIDNSLNVGDIVIGNDFYQHDMDPRPIFKQFEIPLTGRSFFSADSTIIKKLQKSAKDFLNSNTISYKVKKELNIANPKVIIGNIASGDKFISDSADADRIKKALPKIMCVEMEGAAVAQVCFEYNIPFGIVRTISDSANHKADIDFFKFSKEVANKYSIGIIKNYLNS